MRQGTMRPRAQLFVCVNARRTDDPLRSGCGDAGPALFTALKRETLRAGLATELWVTATACLGHCPRTGCSVTLHPRNEHWIEAHEADAAALLRRARDAEDER